MHYPVGLSVVFLSAVFISFSGHVVVGVWLIMLVQVTIWYILRHDNLQSVNQLQETGTRGWIFIPALRHQFISIMDRRWQKVKNSCIVEQTRSIYNICQSQLEIHYNAKSVSRHCVGAWRACKIAKTKCFNDYQACNLLIKNNVKYTCSNMMYNNLNQCRLKIQRRVTWWLF